MRIVAILAAYNEERFIASAIEHLVEQGLEVVLCDNESTDRTVAIARSYLGRGVLAIERIPRPDGRHHWMRILTRKEELATTLEGDWFLHADPDEIHLPPAGFRDLHELVVRADAEGFNAINFLEFCFLPTRQTPDHDHPDFRRTMRHYYPFRPRFPDRLNLWKRRPRPLGLADTGGHWVEFPGRRMFPESGRMKHYLFLSPAHAGEKYGNRRHDPQAVERGWHGWRARVSDGLVPSRERLLELPSEDELRYTETDADLDPREPFTVHPWMEAWASRLAGEADRT